LAASALVVAKSRLRALRVEQGEIVIAQYDEMMLESDERGGWTLAARLTPDFPPAHNDLALTLKGDGKWDEAKRHCREGVQFDRDLDHRQLIIVVRIASSASRRPTPTR
jgi:hypothetical protein